MCVCVYILLINKLRTQYIYLQDNSLFLDIKPLDSYFVSVNRKISRLACLVLIARGTFRHNILSIAGSVRLTWTLHRKHRDLRQ